MTPTESNDLRDSVDSLRDEVRVLRDVLDEVREDISYAVNNGLMPHIDRETETDKPDIANESAAIPNKTPKQPSSSRMLF